MVRKVRVSREKLLGKQLAKDQLGFLLDLNEEDLTTLIPLPVHNSNEIEIKKTERKEVNKKISFAKKKKQEEMKRLTELSNLEGFPN